MAGPQIVHLGLFGGFRSTAGRASASAAAHGRLLGPARQKLGLESAWRSQTATIGSRRAVPAFGLRGRQGAGMRLNRLGEILEGFARPQINREMLCARTLRRAPALLTPRKRIRRTDAASRRTKAKARVCHAGRIPREARLPLKLRFRISERLAHSETVPPRRTKCVVLTRPPARSQPALPRPIYDNAWYYGCVISRF